MANNLTNTEQLSNITHMNINNEIQTLSESIDNQVYTSLIDLEFDPGHAWNATFGAGFSLVEDAIEYPNDVVVA